MPGSVTDWLCSGCGVSIKYSIKTNSYIVFVDGGIEQENRAGMLAYNPPFPKSGMTKIHEAIHVHTF
jgi:hypothetical protein